MPSLTFPDGAMRDFPAGTTGFDVARSISPGLAKKAVAVRVDERLDDLSAEVPDGARIAIVTRDEPDALGLIRHDAAHVLAEAVQSLFPGTQVTIGPVIADGFFYDFVRNEPFSTEDFAAIEARMREIVAADRPFTRRVVSREEAKRLFSEMGERFKVELVDAIPEGEDVRLYAQGDWFDLCRGPHMRSTGQVGKAFKLTKLAGAYWRGNAKGPQLQRIYGTAWASEADLAQHLDRIAEAERRDHRRIGREMDLFHFQEEAPGQVFWHPNGWLTYTVLQDYMRRRQMQGGYVEVNTPQVVDRKLWEASGHWANYRENMFIVEVEEEHAREKRINALKPMNCPCHVQIFNQGIKSYRDLPLRMAEFGACNRYEPSGALHGLMRVRGFRQDDAHIFCSEDQIEGECARFIELLASVYRDLGFETFEIRFSTRPEKRVGNEESWDRMEAALENAIKRTGYPYTLDPGEGAFYAPKLDFKLTDAIGREWQCGTFQVDPNLPERLGAEFVGRDGARHRPFMLHRAILGSFERFIGILIENYAGRFPLWLAPVQAVVATITSDADTYAAEVHAALAARGIRVSLDDRNEKINHKVREHSVAKVPLILVVGRKEAAERTVTVRRLGEGKQESLPLDAAAERIAGDALAPDRRAA